MIIRATLERVQISKKQKMPRKKREKTQEETSAEGYFPVDEDDLKLTTNVPFKESKSVETIEKIGKKKICRGLRENILEKIRILITKAS